MADNPLSLLLRCFLEPIQEFEDEAQKVLLLRSLITATGAQLDTVGSWVGQPRNGMLDEDYRRFIRAKVVVNDSDGLIDDMIDIGNLVVFDNAATMNVTNWGTGSMTLAVTGITLDFALGIVLVAFLRKAVSGGVRIILSFNQSVTPFRFKKFDSTFAANTGYKHFDGTGGGKLGAAIE